MTEEREYRESELKDAEALHDIPQMAYWHMAHRPYLQGGGENGGNDKGEAGKI